MRRRAFLHLFALLASAGEPLASAVKWRRMTAPRSPDPEEAAWDDLTRAIAEDNGAVVDGPIVGYCRPVFLSPDDRDNYGTISVHRAEENP